MPVCALVFVIMLRQHRSWSFKFWGTKLKKKPFAYEQIYLLRELKNYVNTYGWVCGQQKAYFSTQNVYILVRVKSRRPVGSTDQAYPSCFYFRISWILRLGAPSVTFLSTLRDPTQLRRRQWATSQQHLFFSCPLLSSLEQLMHLIMNEKDNLTLSSCALTSS